jgi:subtilisin family serine protease
MQGEQSSMDPIELVKLTTLMARTRGSPDVTIGLIDGPVATDHPDLTEDRVRELTGTRATCDRAASPACRHGTFVTGILSARRGSPAPAICPDCTVLVRPIFSEVFSRGDETPCATPRELAAAITECIDMGARMINLSLAFEEPATREEQALERALNNALRRGAIVAAAAGNQSALGTSVITRHPWVIPVVACDRQGRPMNQSNLGASIGRQGLRAPGDRVTSLGTDGRPLVLGGTSVAVPFVTGAMALLWSEFPSATASQIKVAVTQATIRRASVVPPLLDASAAFLALATANRRRSTT